MEGKWVNSKSISDVELPETVAGEGKGGFRDSDWRTLVDSGTLHSEEMVGSGGRGKI